MEWEAPGPRIGDSRKTELANDMEREGERAVPRPDGLPAGRVHACGVLQ